MNNEYSGSQKKSAPKEYEAMVMQILKRSRNLAKQPPLDRTRFKEVSEEWCSIFYGRIPADQLVRAFEDAAFTKDTGYAVNAYEIMTAWNARARNLQSEASASSCVQWKNHIGGKPEMKAVHPDGMKDIAVPCVHCKPSEFNAIWSNLLAQTPEPMTGGVFALFRKADIGELSATQVRDVFFRMFGHSADRDLPERLRK